MKQSLQLKIGQSLTMTPQLQQAIRLLQLSTLDLQQEIQEALESNPMLENGEDEQNLETNANDSENNNEQSANEQSPENKDTLEDPTTEANDDFSTPETTSEIPSEDEWNKEIPEDLPVDTSWDDVYEPQYTGASQAVSGNDNDDFEFESRRGNTETLQDHLSWQLNLTPMSDRDKVIAETIVDAVEPSGMLAASCQELFNGLTTQIEELELDEVQAVLRRIQHFDPIGVAAENLSDCLLIQLNQMAKTTPFLKAAKLVVRDHLNLLGVRDYRTLMRRTRLKEGELKAVIDLIQVLNPRPGDMIQSTPVEYVIPDVFVHKKNNRWTVELNPEISPKLRINDSYASLVKRADNSTDNTFMRDNLQEARWFLKSLQSRNETLLKVASCIVEQQQTFLDFGDEAMKPLILHDIAEAVEMHESTISRVTTQKFMHTPMGIFELKYFFSSHVSTNSGGECSSTAIRARIKKLVSKEEVRKPLSDSKIAKLLEEEGIQVARRTIAKYRESLHIPPSNERKRLM